MAFLVIYTKEQEGQFQLLSTALHLLSVISLLLFQVKARLSTAAQVTSCKY